MGDRTGARLEAGHTLHLVGGSINYWCHKEQAVQRVVE